MVDMTFVVRGGAVRIIRSIAYIILEPATAPIAPSVNSVTAAARVEVRIILHNDGMIMIDEVPLTQFLPEHLNLMHQFFVFFF